MMLQGIADFTKGPLTVCIINTTDDDLILRPGKILAELSQIEISEEKKQSKTRDTCKVLQLHTLFPSMLDG